jgi:hypothetical protein
MKYFNPTGSNWTRKIKPHLSDLEVQRVLVEDFNKFTFGRWEKRFLPGMTPYEFESCDWWLNHRGPMPHYWHYVKHAACHWLANFNLRLAMLTMPQREWRIVTSEKHSTSWDGAEMLFDFNFCALGIVPDDAFKTAATKGIIMPPGQYIEVHFAEHYSADVERNKRRSLERLA